MLVNCPSVFSSTCLTDDDYDHYDDHNDFKNDDNNVVVFFMMVVVVMMMMMMMMMKRNCHTLILPSVFLMAPLNHDFADNDDHDKTMTENNDYAVFLIFL